MTALEFLYRLKNLSPESRLTLAHLGALFEMLSPVLAIDNVPQLSITIASRLTDETQLAASLGEPVSTVQGWYTPQQIAPNKWYRLGSVMEWITAHIAPLFSDDFLGEKGGDFQFSDITKIWKDQLPVLRVGDDLIGFFRSVREEVAPTSYSMVCETVLALRPSEMGKDALKKIPDSLAALGNFCCELEVSPSKAREIFLAWKDEAIPEVLLQFFRSSLARDIELAKEIAEFLDDDLIRNGFNLTQWFWRQLLASDVRELEGEIFIHVFDMAIGYGVSLNQLSHVSDDRETELFHGNVSHLLADSKGDFYHLTSFDNCFKPHDKLLHHLLKLGLNIDKQNHHSLTARAIGDIVEEKHGNGSSIFKNFVRKYEAEAKFERELPQKPMKIRSKSFKV